MRNGTNKITSEEEKKNKIITLIKLPKLIIWTNTMAMYVFFVCMRLHLAQCFVLIRRRCSYYVSTWIAHQTRNDRTQCDLIKVQGKRNHSLLLHFAINKWALLTELWNEIYFTPVLHTHFMHSIKFNRAVIQWCAENWKPQKKKKTKPNKILKNKFSK